VNRRILVIDDEAPIRSALGQLLEYEGYDVRAVANGADGLTEYDKFRPHLVFSDVKMAGMDGLDVLRALRARDSRALVVMISGHATLATAVEATQAGAYDVMEKPLDTDRILVLLRNALRHLDLEEENATLLEQLDARREIVGQSHAIVSLLERIDKVAATPARVLITGENGTGKELVARAVHRGSARAKKPFIEVNCAAIPGELIESELFGHMRGSFTGAIADRPGKFEQADGGTLFLDEIGDMSLAAQAKVLRVLQDGVVTRIGGTKPVQVDVRVLAATNKELEVEITEGRFREDLFYRLNVVPISVPPLRERREDIPVLIAFFVQQMAQRDGIAPRRFAPDAVHALAELEWSGNVRELRNTVERLLILAGGDGITVADVHRLVGRPSADTAGLGALMQCKSFEDFKLAAEEAFLRVKLREHDWNVSETARALDMPRSNLYKKIERYGLVRAGMSAT
jgi:two-component system, NtrC family, nitrogen regulation response regulator NtrX